MRFFHGTYHCVATPKCKVAMATTRLMSCLSVLASSADQIQFTWAAARLICAFNRPPALASSFADVSNWSKNLPIKAWQLFAQRWKSSDTALMLSKSSSGMDSGFLKHLSNAFKAPRKTSTSDANDLICWGAPRYFWTKTANLAAIWRGSETFQPGRTMAEGEQSGGQQSRGAEAQSWVYADFYTGIASMWYMKLDRSFKASTIWHSVFQGKGLSALG